MSNFNKMRTKHLTYLNFLGHSLIAKHGLYSKIALFSHYAHGELLDVGCGTKPYLPLFEQRVKHYTGLDFSKPAGKRIDHADVVGDADDQFHGIDLKLFRQGEGDGGHDQDRGHIFHEGGDKTHQSADKENGPFDGLGPGDDLFRQKGRHPAFYEDVRHKKRADKKRDGCGDN